MPPDALELKDADWSHWLHHPVTKVYMAFLADQKANLRETAADLIVGGVEPDSPMGKEVRGRILTLGELHTLSLAQVQSFYRERAASQEVGNSGTTLDSGPTG